jgi:hypothetical protein
MSGPTTRLRQQMADYHHKYLHVSYTRDTVVAKISLVSVPRPTVLPLKVIFQSIDRLA